MTAQMMNQQSKPSLKAGKWQVLRPPFQTDNGIEVGVVEIHPALHNRIAYATRSRSEQNHDLGEELVVIQDFNEARHTANPVADPDDGRVIACFSLDDLVSALNDFQKTHSHAKEELPHLSINAIASWTDPITVQTLGAVQHLSFLDREAIRTTAAYGYVKDRPSTDGIYKLLVGFRRCIVSVTLFRTKNQEESHARGLSVQAYIGDFDDLYEGATKAKKKLPASFAVPISEHIVAFGCYDGGLRFYDLLQRKYVKSALGPNGRNNPIVRVMNTNPIIDSGDVTPQTITPKICCACASGVAYLWELDLSIDVMTGEILYFNIPPPVASFDGIVAAVSGKGLPVVHHPSLSPTSIASLSPNSSWEHTDTVNSQFEIAYDPHRNIMFWTFSPDCVGASLLRHASREERLNSNGSLVAWNLSKLPPTSWPPPVHAPCFVVPILRTPKGRVLPSMVVPGILNGLIHSNIFISVYITSCGEIVTALVDLTTQHDSVQRDVCSIILSDVNELRLGDVYSVTASRMQPSMIALGTNYGVLLARVFESDNISRNSQMTTLTTINEESSVLSSIAEQTAHRPPDDSVTASSAFDVDGWSVDPSMTSKQPLHNSDRLDNLQDLKAKLSELESRNSQLEHELEEQLTKSEVSTNISEQRESDLRAQMTSILVEQQSFCDSTKHELQCALKSIECLQLALEEKEKSCAEMELDMDALRTELESTRLKLQQDEIMTQNLPPQITDTSKAIEILEMRLASKNRYCETLQDEIDALKLANEEERKYRKERAAEIVSDLISTERTTVTSDENSELMENELSDLKEKEQSLRTYVDLLEQDKAQLDRELDEYKQKCDHFEREKGELKTTINEQKESISSLVDLLDKREREHENMMSRCNEQVSVIESKCEELQRQLKEETEVATQAETKMLATETANANLRKENARLESEAMQKQALYNAMKYELQNALNELANRDQARSSR
ncbi:hypothetical protein ACHAXN_011780 [Cyclotella atomus]|jgi:hypothetical protein